MKTYTDYKKVIAITEHSAGNESVGTQWIETKSFNKKTPIEDIVKWANDVACSGRLIITIDESEAEDKLNF